MTKIAPRKKIEKQSASSGQFNGFPRDGIEFLAGLERNNNRDWFEQNRAVYQESLKQPAEHFAELLADQLQGLLGRPIRKKIFRIHRDLRFAKDKRPYNAHLRMAFFDSDPTGDGDRAVDFGFYFSLEPRSVVLGAGNFSFSKELLAAYRAALVTEAAGRDLEELVESLVAKGFRLNEPELKRVPSGFDQAHPRAALLRRKSLAFWRDLSGTESVSAPSAVATCLAAFAELLPVRRVIVSLAEAKTHSGSR